MSVLALLILFVILGDRGPVDNPVKSTATEDIRQTAPVAEVADMAGSAGDGGGIEGGSSEERLSGDDGDMGQTAPADSTATAANRTWLPLVADAQALLSQGHARQAINMLKKLQRQDRENAEVHYLLGKAYFKERWVGDGLEAFREAITLDPKYRGDRDLIETAAWALANDDHHYAVSRFLINDIGRDARPALEKVANGHHRDDVRARANRALSQILRLKLPGQ